MTRSQSRYAASTSLSAAASAHNAASAASESAGLTLTWRLRLRRGLSLCQRQSATVTVTVTNLKDTNSSESGGVRLTPLEPASEDWSGGTRSEGLLRNLEQLSPPPSQSPLPSGARAGRASRGAERDASAGDEILVNPFKMITRVI